MEEKCEKHHRKFLVFLHEKLQRISEIFLDVEHSTNRNNSFCEELLNDKNRVILPTYFSCSF